MKKIGIIQIKFSFSLATKQYLKKKKPKLKSWNLLNFISLETKASIHFSWNSVYV